MKRYEVTASALILRKRPGGDDTGKRLIHGQVVEAYGASFDQTWTWLSGPTGEGWASSTYLKEVTGAVTPAWAAVPHGIAAIRSTYGDPTPYITATGGVFVEWQAIVCTGRVRLPSPVPLSYGSESASVIVCHRLIEPRLQSVVDELARRGLWKLVEDYGGCYNWRNARGLTKLSTHAWAIAIDINVARNPLGAKPTQDPRLVAVFKDHGFVYGGDWSRPDGMHFQAASGY